MILYVENIVTPKQNKTQIVHEFEILEDWTGLEITLEYTPKYLDKKDGKDQLFPVLTEYAGTTFAEKNWKQFIPLANLLTITIFDETDFRGAAHKMPNKQKYFIRQESASNGFIASEIKKGKWKIVVSVHLVVTETVEYVLSVTGLEG